MTTATPADNDEEPAWRDASRSHHAASRQWLAAGLLLPMLVLAISLTATHRMWKDARFTSLQAFETDFEFRARDTNVRIQHRLDTYEQVLRGVVALFAASEGVDRSDFNSYVSMLDLADEYPGIQGVGFAVLIPSQEKEAHISTVRKEGFPNYTITPEGERQVYSSIVYLAPFSGRNLRAFGYDMYSEPVRRVAMDNALQTGRAAISGKVTLVQETETDVQNGFLMYLPVYREGASGNLVDIKREDLLGWVYAPFRMDDFMAGLSGEQAADLHIRIHDGKSISDDSLMYDSSDGNAANVTGTAYQKISNIDIGGHAWTVVTSATSRFERRMDDDKPQLVLRAGIGVSVLLTLLAWVVLDDRERAIRAARQAIQLALYDVLTGLPNRKLITDRLHQALAKAKRDHKRVALMFLDLDKFKPINDTYGHAVGDQLLQEVARRVQECVRESDTVARLGGDEFVVLLPDVSGKDSPTPAAKKILHALETPFELAGQRFRISSSIGIAVFPDHGENENELMKNADAAMYQAKRSGRNNMKYFDPEADVEPAA